MRYRIELVLIWLPAGWCYVALVCIVRHRGGTLWWKPGPDQSTHGTWVQL